MKKKRRGVNVKFKTANPGNYRTWIADGYADVLMASNRGHGNRTGPLTARIEPHTILLNVKPPAGISPRLPNRNRNPNPYLSN